MIARSIGEQSTLAQLAFLAGILAPIVVARIALRWTRPRGGRR